jgi:hypothetical protein
MEGLKTWLGSQAAGLFGTGIQKLPVKTSASVPVVTTLRCNISKYVHFLDNNFFLIAIFVNSLPEISFRIAVIYRTVWGQDGTFGTPTYT